MVRIGRQISHFEEVDRHSINAVFSKNMEYRYLLSLHFNNTLLNQEREKTATVIMKNPSAADEKMADATIRKVETYIFHKFPDVRRLHILNIFAYRATEPADLEHAFQEGGPLKVIGEENDRVFIATLEESDYIILAWGNNSGINKVLYEERIFRVKQILNTLPESRIFCICGNRKTKHPLHGLMWGYDYTINPVKEYLQKL